MAIWVKQSIGNDLLYLIPLFLFRGQGCVVLNVVQIIFFLIVCAWPDWSGVRRRQQLLTQVAGGNCLLYMQ